MSYEAERLQEQIAEMERQMAYLVEETHRQSQSRLHMKALRDQLEQAKSRK